jgi:PhzF family phenazine biosynthesis protein
MKRFPFKKIDAFAKAGSSGNPAACVYLTEEASPDEMQRIAQELKGFVSEVVYCLPLQSDAVDYSLKYYSSECEVAFCGHGTIACMYDLIAHDTALLSKEEIIIRTSMGDLTVYNQIRDTDAVFITAPPPAYNGTHLDAGTIAGGLGIDPSSIDGHFPIDLINAGLDTLIVPIRSWEDTVSIWPDEPTLKDFCTANGIDIITVFTNDVQDRTNEAHTRVFAPRFGYLEDPATGSGNSAVGYYLMKNGLWDGTPISIEQGPFPVPNIVKLVTVAGEDGDKQVRFGGSAAVRIEGHYILY